MDYQKVVILVMLLLGMQLQNVLHFEVMKPINDSLNAHVRAIDYMSKHPVALWNMCNRPMD